MAPFVSWLKKNFGTTGVTPPCARGMQLGETFHGFPTHAAPFPLPLVQPGSLCLQHPPTLSVVEHPHPVPVFRWSIMFNLPKLTGLYNPCLVTWYWFYRL